MTVTKFQILFDNPVKTYLAGETISGRIVLVLNAPKKCRGLRIKIKGKAHTSWRNGRVHLRDQEELFLSRYFLIGGKYDKILFVPGEHIFPFKYDLPPKLPSSFESKFGHTIYTMKATIDRPWSADIETEVPFTVKSKYDLNTDPYASEPVVIERTETFGCFSQTPALTINLYLPVRGYVPGQSIRITVNVNNRSGIEIRDLILKLEKHVTYRVTFPYEQKKKEKEIILIDNKGRVAHKDFSFDQVFKIPPLPPTQLGTCNIIDVEYTLKLVAYNDTLCTPNMEISFPILIGSVPLLNYQPLL